MKPSVNKIASFAACILVCLAYLCSATGYDVHTDRHDGKTYVVSLLQGISCAEIHPEDHCGCRHNESACDQHSGCRHNESACCQHSGCRHNESACCQHCSKGNNCSHCSYGTHEDDCSDNIKVLTITGADDEGHLELTPPLTRPVLCQSAPTPIYTNISPVGTAGYGPPPRLHLLKISVLRV